MNFTLCTYSLLELGKISRAQCIGLGDDRNQIDTSTQTFHNLNVQWLQGVAGRANEIQAGVNSKINLLCASRLLFLQHVGFMLIV